MQVGPALEASTDRCRKRRSVAVADCSEAANVRWEAQPGQSSGATEIACTSVWVAPGAWPMYPKGVEDDTHLSLAGATAIARLAAIGIKATGLPLGAHVVGVE